MMSEQHSVQETQLFSQAPLVTTYIPWNGAEETYTKLTDMM